MWRGGARGGWRSGAEAVAVILGDALPPRPLLGAQPGVVAHRHPARLPAELQVALPAALRQLARVEGGQHGAAGLGAVLAVVEPALLAQRLDLGEHPVERLADVGEADAAQ